MKCRLLVLAMLFALAPERGLAGQDTLGDFEDEIERTERRERRDDGAAGDAGSDWSDVFPTLLGAMWSSGGASSGGGDYRPGAPAQAFARIESTYQRFSTSDVDGLATRAELFLAFIGVGGEFVRYWEDSPSQHLDLGTVEGLFRIAPSEGIKLTFAAGSRRVAGNRSRWAHGGGVTLGLYPLDWTGLEVDLRWMKVGDRALGDYRVGALLRVPDFRYLALRAGYRVLQYQSETLDGPEIGLVATW